MRRKSSGLAAGAVSAAALLVIGVQAQGQEGPLLTFDLSFGGRYEVNDPSEDESRLSTGFGIELQSSNRTQSFRLATDGRFSLENGEFEFEQPGIEFDYGRQTRSTALDADFSYSIQDVSGTSDLIDPITGDILDLVNDDGTLETVQFGIGLDTGRDARFGTSTRFSFTDRTYADTSDPDLIDLQSWQIGTTLSFDVSPLIDLQGTASYRDTREEDEQNSERRVARFGLDGSFQVDPLWTVTTGLTYVHSETEEDVVTGGRQTETEERGGFSVAAQRQFRNGSLGASFARNIRDIGTQDTLRLSNDRRLASGATLAWSLGLVSFPSGETGPIFSASYAQPTSRGNLLVDFNQSTAVDDDDNSVVNTALGLNWSREINAVSSWSLNGSLQNVDVRSDTGEDQARARIGVSYNHALTRDWDFSTALSHRVTYVDGGQDSNASTLSFSLQRSFSFRP